MWLVSVDGGPKWWECGWEQHRSVQYHGWISAEPTAGWAWYTCWPRNGWVCEHTGLYRYSQPVMTHLPLLQSNLNPNSVPILLILRDLMTSLFSSVALIYLQQDCVGSIGRSFTCSRRLRYLPLHLLSLGIIYRQGCPLSALSQCRCPVTNRGLSCTGPPLSMRLCTRTISPQWRALLS